MLPACTPGQLPYAVGDHSSLSTYWAQGGDTPAIACRAFSVATGYSYHGNTTEYCTVTSNPAVYHPIIKICDPLTDVTAGYDYASGGALWAFGFTGVMFLYLTSHGIGLVLRFLRDR